MKPLIGVHVILSVLLRVKTTGAFMVSPPKSRNVILPVNMMYRKPIPVSIATKHFSTGLQKGSNLITQRQLGSQLGQIDTAPYIPTEDPIAFNRIKERFEAKMKNVNIPLLKDFDSYSPHLPVREYKRRYGHMRLHEVSYFARREDLQQMAKDIETKPPLAKGVVHYLCAPIGTGKSASVLPAFLESQNATHYFYIPYNNNDGRYFNIAGSEELTKNASIAEFQGASFMLRCVKTLLENKRTGIHVDTESAINCMLQTRSPKEVMQNYIDELKTYLDEKLGADARIWFHVDSQGRLMKRHYQKPELASVAAAFSRGSMQVLTALSNHIVVTSFGRPPTEFSTNVSSDICRYPIALPELDIDQVLRYVPALNIGETVFVQKKKQRLFNLLRFRLAAKLVLEIGTILAFHEQDSLSKASDFLTEFQNVVEKYKPLSQQKRKLIALNKLCIPTYHMSGYPDDNAAKVLVGVDETAPDSEWIFNYVPLVVSGPERFISRWWVTLFELNDLNIKPYRTGKRLMLNALYTARPDCIQGTPLEYAYYWALSCTSALQGSICFDKKHKFQIKCKELLEGCLINKATSELDKEVLKQMQKNAMYYYDQDTIENGTQAKASYITPHLCFRTNDNRLVIVHITGDGAVRNLRSKLTCTAKWLHNHDTKITNTTLQDGECIKEVRCILLAPNVDDELDYALGVKGVDLVCHNSAIALLRGLSQIYPWLAEPKSQK